MPEQGALPEPEQGKPKTPGSIASYLNSTAESLPFYVPGGDLTASQDRAHLQQQPIAQTTDTSMFELETPQVQHEELDQLPTTNEPVDAQSRQEHTTNPAQPGENVKAKRQRGRIQEQPVGTQHTPPVPNSEQKTPPNDVDVQTERKSQPRRAADDLFVPQDIDRSPQAWMARLTGTKSTDHDDAAPSDMQLPTPPEEPIGTPVAGTEIVQGREAIYYSGGPDIRPVEGTEIMQGREAIHYSGGTIDSGGAIDAGSPMRFFRGSYGCHPIVAKRKTFFTTAGRH